ELRGREVDADPRQLARIPFIPAEVWTHVVPRGPVDVDVRLSWAPGRTPGVRTRTTLTLHETSARFPTLDIAATSLTGQVVVDGAVVRVDRVQGRSLSGRVGANGTMEFARAPAHVDLVLDLAQVDVAKTPPSWQLDEAGITGLLTGRVHLRAVLNGDDVDLSGSTGDAVVEKASIQGIPVKSLHLAMHAHGNTLEYDTEAPGEAS